MERLDLMWLCTDSNGPAEFGYERLIGALRKRGYDVAQVLDCSSASANAMLVAGTAGDWEKAQSSLLNAIKCDASVKIPKGREELAIARCKAGEKDVIAVIGGDEVGLMYGLLEIADILDKGGTLADVPNMSESPHVPVRGIFTFLHNEDLEREWFYSRQFWQDYFGMLAQNRYNSFNLVFSHQTYYLAPLFPFFIDVPEHPEVAAIGLNKEEQRRNLEMLRYICELAEQRGIDFVLGVWQVSSWKDSVFGGGDQVRTMVEGLNWDNLESYTYHGLKHLLNACPGIKGVQIRANEESGVPRSIQTEFFSNSIFRAIKDCGRKVHLDLRYWIAKPETIQAAIDMEIPLSLSMKYWAEHQGPPYQAAEQLPAYSYADFLKKPLAAPIMYQLWSLGTHRVLLWGDPEYARRFALSMELGDARGFEVNPPLAQKGYGNEPGYWRIMACRDLEYYRWEYERYWFYYLLFGRMSYNPETSPEVWRRELRSRFGPKAEIAEKAYAVSSKVISYLIRYQMSDPNMYTWPEIDTGGILDYYMETYPSDPATMHSIAEAAAFRLTERTSAKVTPEEASTYFENIGRQCLEMAKELESSDSDRELVATRLDVSVLGNMALYHAYKIRSAEQLSLYYLTKDLAALKQAAALIREANSFWHECVRLTDGFYYDHMVTGPIDSGHWKDKLVLIDDDEKRLEELIRLYEECAPFDYAFDFGGKPERRTRRENMIFSIHDNYHVEKHFIGVDEVSRYNPITGFGWTTSTRVVGATHPHIRISDRDLDDRRRDTGRVFNECLVGFRNALYNDYVWSNAPGSFLVDLPGGVYEATIIAANPENNTSDYGPMYAQINGQLLLDGVVVPKGKKLVVKREVEVVGGRLRLDLWADSGKSWFISGLVINRAGITLTHVPPSRLDAEQECTLQVTAKGTIDTVRSVWFNVCDDNSSNDSKDCCSSSRMVELKQVDDFIYEGAIPKELLKNSRQLRYCIVAEGTSGRRYILGTEQPFSVPVKHRESVIEVEHEPVRYAKWSNDIRIRCRIASSNPIKVVRLYYRHVNQYYTFQVQPMKLVDPSEMIYEGVIPAEYHDRNWDLMYYVEVVDSVGTGIFYPDPMKETPYIVIREEQSH